MKAFTPRARTLTALLMAVCLLLMPLTAYAKKGEKNYRRGLEHEQAQQWEKAAQEFALALAASPSDTEYQLHYRRAVFNASQVFMQRGQALAEQGDYKGAYNAFRQAYGYDPVNELAANEMRRMIRLQREKEGLPPVEDGGADGMVSPTRFRPAGGANGTSTPAPRTQTGANGANGQQPPLSTRSEQLRVINYSGELEPFIRKLAEELSLNVIFDKDFSTQQKRTINVQLRDVTTAQALDYIFLAYGLFFQKVSRRTILVADQSKRPQYQQLVLRTFYLQNIKPDKARQLISQMLPPNTGRNPGFSINEETNSITVRDTPENIRLIGELLKTVDKDRAEVVMEVAIYEVTRKDLLQIGNQFGNESSLGNLGGLQVTAFGGRSVVPAGGTAALPTVLAGSLILPTSVISALQTKDNTRLVFQTQVHAFDDEKSETRIGARVPVQTAAVTPFGFGGGTGTGTGTGGGTSPGVFGNGYPVIQYEDTGLSLDFTPKVYPNNDVQVKMVIDTKDTGVSGAGNLTPTFTQRRITGTARIPNNRTMMIASIAQDRNTEGRAGLPLISLIPILGRLFSTPLRNNSQNDVVITMTPRVLRAPVINPSDEVPRTSGTMQTPTSETLEAMVHEADMEDQLARARQLPTNRVIELVAPDAATPPQQQADTGVTYVPAPISLLNAARPSDTGVVATTSAATTSAATTTSAPPVNTSALPANTPAPSAASATSAQPAVNNGRTTTAVNTLVANTTPASMTTAAVNALSPRANAPSAPAPSAAPALSTAELRLVPEAGQVKVGERRRLMLLVKTDAPLGLASATLRFDARSVAIRSVTRGTMFDAKTAEPVLSHSVDAAKGVLLLTLAPAAGAPALTGEGILLFIEVEGVAAGDARFEFDADKVHLVATDGRSVLSQATQTQVRVIQ